MKSRIFFSLILFSIWSIGFSFAGYAAENSPKTKIACVGNSITYGAGIPNRERDSYPSVLGQMLGSDYEVVNFGFSARTLLLKGELPYMKEKMYSDALNYQPDIVVIKLGTNDTKPQNWKFHKNFKKDLLKMIGDFESLPTQPKIYLCYPAKIYALQWGINDSIALNGVIPVIKQVAKEKQLEIIDLYAATSGMKEHFPDNIHPDEAGAIRLAETVYKAITGKEKKHTQQPFPGVKSEWFGYDRYDYQFHGREAVVVVPKKAAEGNPWIWRPAFFGAFPSVDKSLLDKGFHVVYLDVTYCYASPYSLDLGTQFYNKMVNTYGLSSKVTLEGLSRGGMFAINWSAQHPENVACIYVDAPVCDVFTCLKQVNPDLWKEMLQAWELTDETINRFDGNPIEQLKPLAKAGIPIIGVCGDSDRTVPYEQNMDILRQRYLALGGTVELILKPGCDHHPHSLENPEPIVNFILRQQPEFKKFQHYTLRGTLKNSFLKFENERKGRVAFLGGSITEMKGWKDMIEQQLKQRFPFTDFEFVEAGIGSTGSTPGAFRLENDILSKGTIDLLFVEAAVNDHTNYFTPEEQIRGMEGEVRHALETHPETDIVMLHFIYDPFIPMITKRQIPDVILNHERVANHYGIPSINLAQEIGERMQAGQFTWDEFGGTHPLPLGHTFYAAAINNLFDEMQREIAPNATPQPHAIPTEPLDKYSYTKGKFLPLTKAKLQKGWQLVNNWNPENRYEKRRGFVQVPMLEATRPGDQLTLQFKGKAIGIFCVCGPSAGILEYSIDHAPFKKLDTYTEWSQSLYIPWVYMLETELKNTEHTLILRISKDKNEASLGTECQIRNFVVNE